jgi:hypothetical protein
MKFLLPVDGVVDDRFGILTSPAHWGIAAGICAGLPWAADNGAYSGAFDADGYLPWLEALRPYAAPCLFVLAPDAVGDAATTLERYREWVPRIRALGFPVGFAAQDGVENLALPDDFDALFVGGTTAWKLGSGALWAIHEAQRRGKHIHIGRVNYWRRYEYFAGLEGSDDWTCDGTRTRFEGRARAMAAWAGYQQRPYNLRLSVSERDCDG